MICIVFSGKMVFCRVVCRVLKLYIIVLLIKFCIYMYGINESIYWLNIWNLFILIINVIWNMLLLMKKKGWVNDLVDFLIIYGFSKYKDVFINMLVLCCKSLVK